MHLLRFTTQAAARKSLGDRFDAAVPTSLVTADAVFSKKPNEQGFFDIVSERKVLPGFWLLAGDDETSHVVAVLGPDGVITTKSGEIIGARLDPIVAGMPDGMLEMTPAVEPEVEPVPEIISDRQFVQQLAILGTITETEAIAWAARGDLPETLEAAVATLPAAGGVQFAARMLVSSATSYERSNPLTATLGAILGYDEADLDALWRAAAAL